MNTTKPIDGFKLKIIAIISMVIDHTGAILFDNAPLLRSIGRIAFPIFCFLLVEGFFNTSNIKKYILRLFIFLIISEIPFDLAFYNTYFYPGHQNVFFTLFIGLVTIAAIDKCVRSKYFISFIIPAVLGTVIAEFLNTDYGAFGIIIILSFYFARYYNDKLYGIGGVFLYVMSRFNPIRLFTLVALIPIYFYNGKRGKNIRIFFYVFYPLHLFLLAIIHLYL